MTEALELLTYYVAGLLVVLATPRISHRLRTPPVVTTIVAGAAFGIAWCACAANLLAREEMAFRNGPWRYFGLPPGVVTGWQDAAVGHATFWALVGLVTALWVGRRERGRPGPNPPADEG